MNKYAFITMDVESFFDTYCMNKRGIEKDESFDCSKEVERFIDYLTNLGIKATLFVNISFLPRVKTALLKAKALGFDIALHSLEHRPAVKYTIEEFRESVQKAKDILKQELDIVPNGYRFPGFKFTQEHLQVIKDEGFIYDSSYQKEPKDYQKLHDNVYVKDDFYEFSLSRKFMLFKRMNISGGGNLRLLPFKMTYRKITTYVKKHDSYVLYFHPFEIYEGTFPKYKKLNIFQKLYINQNRNTFFNKIDMVINLLKQEGYHFLTMSEYIKNHAE